MTLSRSTSEPLRGAAANSTDLDDKPSVARRVRPERSRVAYRRRLSAETLSSRAKAES